MPDSRRARHFTGQGAAEGARLTYAISRRERLFAGRRRFILEGMSEGTRILQAEVADPQASQLVQLRYFAGLTEAAAILEVSPPSADRACAYARAWRLRG